MAAVPITRDARPGAVVGGGVPGGKSQLGVIRDGGLERKQGLVFWDEGGEGGVEVEMEMEQKEKQEEELHFFFVLQSLGYVQRGREEERRKGGREGMGSWRWK